MPGTSGRPEVMGSVAHDSANAADQNPVKLGAVAHDFDGTALPAAVADLDVSDLRATVDGRFLVEIGHPRFFSVFTTTAAAASQLSLQAAPGAGLSLYVTDVVASSDTIASIRLLDDATLTGEFMHARVLANTSFSHQFRQPKKLTANKPLGYTTSATVTSLHVSGFIAP